MDVRDLGRMAYREAWTLQKRLVSERATGLIPDTLLLVEHPPTVTLGRGTRPEDLRLTPEAIAARGAECIEIERGGRATYHGPGQWVGYPIVSLRACGLTPVSFLRRVEGALIHVVADFGIDAAREPGLTGVWVAGDKIAAIGIAVSRGITYHGFALNVRGALAGFDWIVPCGISTRERGVTSMERVLGRAPSMPDVAAAISRRMAPVLDGVPA